MTNSAGFIALFGCSSHKLSLEENQFISDPLVINWEVRSSNPNAWHSLGDKLCLKDATSYFSIKHRGNPIHIPNQNTGKEVFYQALFLKDAAKQAVLAGTRNMYLITDENGKPNVKLLDAGDRDYGKFQWLDSENGQPGKQEKIYQTDNSKSSRFLSGGRYLLINSRVLLDVQTLITYPIDINSDLLNGFNASQSVAICMSPGKTQFVLRAYRRNPDTNMTENALIVVDFRRNQAYAVPFNLMNTQLSSLQNANASWVSTFFDWTINGQGKEVLSLHAQDKLTDTIAENRLVKC